MIVDAWAQLPTETFKQQTWMESILRWVGVDELPDIPPEMLVGAMDAANVDKAMLAAWHSPTGPLIPNEFVADICEKFPERFFGLAAVDLNKPVEAVRSLRHYVKDRGFKGLRVVPWLWNLPPDDRRYYPLYVECCELGVPFATQIGHTGPLCPSEPGRPIPYLEQVLLDFPELVVVGGHVGEPWLNEVLSLAHKFPNFYIDTSAYVAHRYPEALVRFMNGRGKTRVLFGTNFPMLMPSACLARLDELGLDDDAKVRFLGQNAIDVYGL